MSLLSKCPTEIQTLVESFNAHPFQVGTQMYTTTFHDNYGLATGTKWAWLQTCEWEQELQAIGWKHTSLFYEVVQVAGTEVTLKAYTTELDEQNDEEKDVQVGELLRRNVQHTISEDGTHSWFIVLRNKECSSGGGPQWDDQLRFSPLELLEHSECEVSTDVRGNIYWADEYKTIL